MPQCPRCGNDADRRLGRCTVCSGDWETDAFFPAATFPAPIAPSSLETPAPSPGSSQTGKQQQGPLVRIARFRGAAEAGYFADVLRTQSHIPVELAVDEDRDPMHGTWSVHFTLLAPATHAEQSVLLLKQMIAESADEAVEPANSFCHPDEEPARNSPLPPQSESFESDHIPTDLEAPGSNVHWVPIILTLAAGSAAFLGARKAAEAPRENRARPQNHQQQDSIWDHLHADEHPWRQPTSNGRGFRELTVSPQKDWVKIREDLDGDGRFDRERKFLLEASR